jgi:asparagine synthase (glutamine-hydrolysing)
MDKDCEQLRLPRARVDPVKALEEVLASALSRPPCVVSFSGGRDSSGLLAVATKVSRERGFPPPVPATLVFPGDALVSEDEWQGLVIKELGLTEWSRIQPAPGELDVVGPVAALLLKRHGQFMPFNAHVHYPIIQLAAGGSLVTGFGGDEMAMASASARAERLLARQERSSSARTLASVGLAFAPRWIRGAVYRRRFDDDLPWLTPHGYGVARAEFARQEASYPFGFDRKLQWDWRTRYTRVYAGALTALASSHDVQVVNPFISRDFLAALAQRGGIPGLGNRRDLVCLLFGGVLPPPVLERTSKAVFDNQVWTATATEFALEWSGEGIDGNLVELARLRDHWLDEGPNARSSNLLQCAWLHDHGADQGRLEKVEDYSR